MLSHTPLERAKARDELSEHIRHPRAANVLGKKKKSLTTFCYCFNSAQHELSLSKTMKPSLHREVLYLHLLLSVNGSSPAFMHMAPPMCVFVSILKMVSPPQLPVLLYSTQGSPYIQKNHQLCMNFNRPRIYFQQWQFWCWQHHASSQNKVKGSK